MWYNGNMRLSKNLDQALILLVISVVLLLAGSIFTLTLQKTFAAGENYHAEQLFGPHRVEEGYLFRVWAPNAQMIWLVGDFSGWELRDAFKLSRIAGRDVWEGEFSYLRKDEVLAWMPYEAPNPYVPEEE